MIMYKSTTTSKIMRYTVSPQHMILQRIGCHSSVNTGNFESDLSVHIDDLLDQGHVSLSVSEGESWVTLTRSGLDLLLDLNSQIDHQLHG